MTAHWKLRAACRDADPELFTPTIRGRGRHGRDLTEAREVARTYCQGCAVLTSCRDHAERTRAHSILQAGRWWTGHPRDGSIPLLEEALAGVS